MHTMSVGYSVSAAGQLPPCMYRLLRCCTAVCDKQRHRTPDPFSRPAPETPPKPEETLGTVAAMRCRRHPAAAAAPRAGTEPASRAGEGICSQHRWEGGAGGASYGCSPAAECMLQSSRAYNNLRVGGWHQLVGLACKTEHGAQEVNNTVTHRAARSAPAAAERHGYNGRGKGTTPTRLHTNTCMRPVVPPHLPPAAWGCRCCPAGPSPRCQAPAADAQRVPGGPSATSVTAGILEANFNTTCEQVRLLSFTIAS